MSVITTHALTRRFGKTMAVDDLSLTLHAGELFGFLGHNGAGKTTTVRLLNGVLSADSGTAQVLGYNPFRDGAALRRHTGVLTETPALDERLSATENLALTAELFGVESAEIPRRIHDLLTLFALADRAREKVGGYSKGMKQRLALARAILHQPRLLFLDEPTAALDPVATRHVHDLIARMAREEGRTIVLCTHNLVEAQRLCDRVAVMEQGRLLALGSPHELARRYVHNLTVEIEVAPEQIAAAQAVLAAANPALTLTPGHSGLLHLAGARREELPDLVAALTTSGVRLYQVTPLEPSLEDVYFALHRAHGTEEESA